MGTVLRKKDSNYYGNDSEKNNCTCNEKIKDKNDGTYCEKTDKINTLISKGKKFQHKISLGIFKEKEKREFTTILNKLLDLNYFNDELHDKLFSQEQ